MEKLDKIYGQQISFETSTQKLLDEVLSSKDVEKVGKKSKTIWDKKTFPSSHYK